MKIKPATPAQANALRLALRFLRHARVSLTDADCPQALDAVRRALKSAEGAQRHMLRRLQHRDPVTGEPLRREPSDTICPGCSVANAPEALRCIACATPLQG